MRKIQNIFRMKKGKIRNQRGVALIFTLGILGLLTVMALGFASTAMLNQKIASNSAGASSAKMLAQVGVQRALTAVALYTADAANNAVGFSDIFSREYGSGKTGNQNTCDFIWKLTTKINDIPLYELPVDYDNKSGVTWQYVTDPSDMTNNTLIGRYAYVVVPYYGALDPSVNYGQSFTDSTANPDNKLFTVYNIDMDKGISQGLKDTFTSLSSTIGGSGGNASVITDNDSITTALTKAYNGRFYDLSEYVKRILYESSWAAKENANETNMIKRMKLFYYLKNIFAVNPYAYPEAYWIDCDKTGSDQKRASDHYLHRLSLDALADFWRSSPSASTGDFSNIINGLTNPDNISSLSYSSTALAISEATAIPWLAAWTASSESSDWKTKVDLEKKQIAANLIQYNLDADKPNVSNITTVFDPAKEPPTLEYLGIGRHPYLNEIGVEMRITAEVEPPAANTTAECKYTLKPFIGFNAELIDMYGLNKPTNLNVYFYGTLSFTYKLTNAADAELKTWTSNADALLGTLSVTGDRFWNTDGSYTNMKIEINNEDSSPSNVGAIMSEALKNAINSGSNLEGKVEITTDENGDYDKTRILCLTEVSVKLSKVILTEKNSEEYIRDYAIPEDQDFSIKGLGSDPVPLLTTTDYAVKSYQATDPRLNHYPSDWTKDSAFQDGDFSTYSVATPGTKNKPLDAYTGKFNGTDYDKETVTEIACTGTATGRLSSAMIRHGKMRSLAELGLIHRASPFQTLNLKKARYIKRDTELKKAGGASYKEGDANILDQLKLRGNDVMKQYGKVNINTASHETLQALFNSVPYQKLVDSPLPADAKAYEIFKTAPVAAKYVNDVTDANVTGARKACGHYHPETAASESSTHPSCLACSIINRREVLQFKARSDLMLDLNDSAWTDFDNDNKSFYLKSYLPKNDGSIVAEDVALKALSKSGQMTQGPVEGTSVSVENDWEQEQLIGHLADVITAEPPDLCIIAVGQTLKDIGGSKVYRNWSISDQIGEKYYTTTSDAYKAYRKAGYIRPGQTNDYLENNRSSSVLGKGILKVAGTPISKDKDVELGVYDVGFDKITGESKMIVWVRKDPVTQKWKVVRTMYAE